MRSGVGSWDRLQVSAEFGQSPCRKFQQMAILSGSCWYWQVSARLHAPRKQVVLVFSGKSEVRIRDRPVVLKRGQGLFMYRVRFASPRLNLV